MTGPRFSFSMATATAPEFVIGTDLKELQHFGKRVAQ